MTRVLAVLAALVVGAFCLIGVYVVLTSVLLHGPVNERSLYQSVSGVAGSALLDVGGPCEEAGAAWRCDVHDRAGSGYARYRVTVGADGSCWEATLVVDRSEGGMPEALSGCVRRLESSLL